MLKVKLVNPTEAVKLLGQHHGLYIQLRASRHCVHAGRWPGAVTAAEAEGASRLLKNPGIGLFS